MNILKFFFLWILSVFSKHAHTVQQAISLEVAALEPAARLGSHPFPTPAPSLPRNAERACDTQRPSKRTVPPSASTHSNVHGVRRGCAGHPHDGAAHTAEGDRRGSEEHEGGRGAWGSRDVQDVDKAKGATAPGARSGRRWVRPQGVRRWRDGAHGGTPRREGAHGGTQRQEGAHGGTQRQEGAHGGQEGACGGTSQRAACGGGAACSTSNKRKALLCWGAELECGARGLEVVPSVDVVQGDGRGHDEREGGGSVHGWRDCAVRARRHTGLNVPALFTLLLHARCREHVSSGRLATARWTVKVEFVAHPVSSGKRWSMVRLTAAHEIGTVFDEASGMMPALIPASGADQTCAIVAPLWSRVPHPVERGRRISGVLSGAGRGGGGDGRKCGTAGRLRLELGVDTDRTRSTSSSRGVQARGGTVTPVGDTGPYVEVGSGTRCARVPGARCGQARGADSEREGGRCGTVAEAKEPATQSGRCRLRGPLRKCEGVRWGAGETRDFSAILMANFKRSRALTIAPQFLWTTDEGIPSAYHMHTNTIDCES
ncbi:hypothetical protein DFH07DRAFT_777142 [Mycena maculata]|uniref:Uncharacterized protein n=1 Tax=Mycena maculata TaxID=230809 RepID=A0AAD7IJG6_9AGAR|nr:hypothetical protein DFH07DRAFT_777142 [Mycena maculata]